MVLILISSCSYNSTMVILVSDYEGCFNQILICKYNYVKKINISSSTFHWCRSQIWGSAWEIMTSYNIYWLVLYWYSQQQINKYSVSPHHVLQYPNIQCILIPVTYSTLKDIRSSEGDGGCFIHFMNYQMLDFKYQSWNYL